MTLHEYAFDVKLAAVVRVQAKDEHAARGMLAAVLDCVDLSDATIAGLNSRSEMRITEASVYQDDSDGPALFEVDGKEPE